MSSSSIIHKREQDTGDAERYAKRTKLDEPQEEGIPPEKSVEGNGLGSKNQSVLPPSHALLCVPLPVIQEGTGVTFMETDVGISEYIGCGVPKIEGIIKQR